MQDRKTSHAYTSISVTCLPNQRLQAKTTSAKARFWLTAWQQETLRGVIPSKPIPGRQAGANCDRVCLSSNENISLSLLEARAKI